MEIIPTSKTCEIYSWQPMLLLCLRQQRNMLGRTSPLFYLIFEPPQKKMQPDELCPALEAVSPGIKHNMKTKCGAWEIQVKVARLARVESLQLFQEHFYFCTIVHFFLAQKILNILKTAFLENKQPREQPISVIQFLLVPKNLWP